MFAHAWHRGNLKGEKQRMRPLVSQDADRCTAAIVAVGGSIVESENQFPALIMARGSQHHTM